MFMYTLPATVGYFQYILVLPKIAFAMFLPGFDLLFSNKSTSMADCHLQPGISVTHNTKTKISKLELILT